MKAGFDEIVVVPLLLTRGLPRARSTSRVRSGGGDRAAPAGCRSRPSEILGLEATVPRGARPAGCARRCGRRPGSASSTRWCRGRGGVVRPAGQPGRWPGWPGVWAHAPPAARSHPRRSPPVRSPATGEAVRAFRAEGRRHVAVASLFLAPGFLGDAGGVESGDAPRRRDVQLPPARSAGPGGAAGRTRSATSSRRQRHRAGLDPAPTTDNAGAQRVRRGRWSVRVSRWWRSRVAEGSEDAAAQRRGRPGADRRAGARSGGGQGNDRQRRPGGVRFRATRALP